MRFCALIPAYNEERTIANVVERVREKISDVAVIDDGSSDQTSAMARQVGAHVLRHPWNMGKGAALATGCGWAVQEGFDTVVTLDADGQHDPADLPRLMERAGEGDIVIGTRLGDLSTMPKKNRLGNLASTRCISRLAGQDVGDSQSGFRVISVKVWQGLDLRTAGFATESEMLIEAGRRGWKILTVPVKTIYTGEERSKFKVVRDSFRIARLILKYVAKDVFLVALGRGRL